MNAIYRINGPDGETRRKVMCPAGELALQLAPDEVGLEVSPLEDGFGIVAPVSDIVGGAA